MWSNVLKFQLFSCNSWWTYVCVRPHARISEGFWVVHAWSCQGGPARSFILNVDETCDVAIRKITVTFICILLHLGVCRSIRGRGQPWALLSESAGSLQLAAGLSAWQWLKRWYNQETPWHTGCGLPSLPPLLLLEGHSRRIELKVRESQLWRYICFHFILLFLTHIIHVKTSTRVFMSSELFRFFTVLFWV